ncbi:hypothetical protein F5883DRAFT_682140 [Diaporthe sp. PMI_573]|nr:hypothetical protein F5883DRAFT_682140 [Diaporthaceae sp. PMI_573]
MKCTIFVAFVATLFPRAAFSAPIAVSIAAIEPGHSGYESHVGAAARDELSTAGRSGYNSVGTTARRATIATNTDGRSGYNSVDVTSQAGLTDFTTDGRSGYNSVEVAEHNGVTSAETDGRGGYNSGSTETKVTTDAETDGRSGYN